MGEDFLTKDEHDVFYRYRTGQVHVLAVSSSGQVTQDQELAYPAGALSIDPPVTVIGTGLNFFGQGGSDVFMRSGSGAVSIYESQGVYTSPVIKTSGTLAWSSAAFAIDAATTVIGTGLNFFGQGGSDVFMRSGSGAVSIYESQGVYTSPVIKASGTLAWSTGTSCDGAGAGDTLPATP